MLYQNHLQTTSVVKFAPHSNTTSSLIKRFGLSKADILKGIVAAVFAAIMTTGTLNLLVDLINSGL